MKLPRVLAMLMGIALLVAAIGCSTTPPVEVAPTPNIDATVDARVKQERSADATVVAKLKQEIAAQPTDTPVVVVKEVTPTDTPAPTNTPIPTNTPVPTATPIPLPTATLHPTATPTTIPTPTLKPTSTPLPTPTPLPPPTRFPTNTPKPPTPTPRPTYTPTPRPTPVPLLKAFSSTLSPSVTISNMVHSFRWSLENRYREKVTVLTASVLTEDGKVITEIAANEIKELWGSGDIEPGGSLSVTTSFRSYFYTTTEVSKFQTFWTIETQSQGTIACTFKPSFESCISL